MRRSLAARLSRKEGRRSRRPLIVARSLPPPVPRRVARPQSPPPLRRRGALLRLDHGDGQHSCPPELRGQRPPSGGWVWDRERFELRHGLQTLHAITLQRLILDPLRNSPTDSTEEPFFFSISGYPVGGEFLLRHFRGIFWSLLRARSGGASFAERESLRQNPRARMIICNLITTSVKS